MTSEKTIYGYCECKSKKEVQGKLHTDTITLSASGWDSDTLTQTMECSIVTADNIVWIAPETSTYAMYTESNIRATAQADGSLTFTCDSIPSEDVIAQVVAT